VPHFIGEAVTTPIKVFGDYVVCFEAEPEDISMRRHFIKECGWTESRYRKIKNYAWFSAKVSVWKDAKELATDYLGACCYKTKEVFYTTYVGDYFADMVNNCAEEIKDPLFTHAVDAWRNQLRPPAWMTTHITSEKAARAFIYALFDNHRLYHLEDDPSQIINSQTGAPAFTPEEVPLLRSRVAECFEVMDDPMELCLSLVLPNGSDTACSE